MEGDCLARRYVRWLWQYRQMIQYLSHCQHMDVLLAWSFSKKLKV